MRRWSETPPLVVRADRMRAPVDDGTAQGSHLLFLHLLATLTHHCPANGPRGAQSERRGDPRSACGPPCPGDTGSSNARRESLAGCDRSAGRTSAGSARRQAARPCGHTRRRVPRVLSHDDHGVCPSSSNTRIQATASGQSPHPRKLIEIGRGLGVPSPSDHASGYGRRIHSSSPYSRSPICSARSPSNTAMSCLVTLAISGMAALTMSRSRVQNLM